jgi:hypothetical protein
MGPWLWTESVAVEAKRNSQAPAESHCYDLGVVAYGSDLVPPQAATDHQQRVRGALRQNLESILGAASLSGFVA